MDLSAVDRKFGQDNTIDESRYHYCPLIGETLDASELSAQSARSPNPVKPICAILKGDNWDDEYLFEFLSIRAPQAPDLCAIFNSLFSSDFTSTPAERSFLKLWFLAMHLQMDKSRNTREVFLEEADFVQERSKLFQFLFPIPQVWVSILPKPNLRDHSPSPEIEDLQHYPQRVDFLLAYNGRLHVIEIDGDSHFSSESRYRRTLATTRALEMAGYKVHRFTNEEITHLKGNGTGHRPPNAPGFVELLRSSGLEPEEMVFICDREGDMPANPAY